MFENILTDHQLVLAEKLMPLFRERFYLVGGTAVSLHIGHRRSIDFDLASLHPIEPFQIERKLLTHGLNVQHVLNATGDEFSVIIHGIRITFFFFPFQVKPEFLWDRFHINLPSILTLGAMKAYALGRRSKWKDYVDLYFILKSKHSLDELIAEANTIFSASFNDKLFREQLCYFDDMDYSEGVEYMDVTPTDDEIKVFLESEALKI
ncbi:MAG: nucleotidyl transferase AbiEii/AbiGii toxin family protein [Deltaproteobacteria bacterium]|nr:nucleotidyl transferase AbiEii/AbiGii toxin family protein [Deltaproteobacteria bacterium]